ncbi:MAG: VCBS repeat-containing protein [Spartobacteria bacterium]|nr:VCBS repeat-containing protein [Spartobacteria bacterium]
MNMNSLRVFRAFCFVAVVLNCLGICATPCTAAEPPVLRYGTFLGGTGTDVARAATLDSEGNMYVISSSDSEITGRTEDMILVKFNRIGEVEYMKVYGGTNGYFANTEEDVPFDITLDSKTNIIIVGETRSSDFPMVHPIQTPTGNTYWDGFILKVDPTGEEILFSTCLRGTENDTLKAVAVDAHDNIYVTGHTSSDDFILHNSAQTTNAGWTDVVVARITTNYTLDYSIIYGGAGFDFGLDIVVNAQGHATVLGDAGFGSSNSLLRTPNAIQTNFHQSAENGGDDFLVLQVDGAGDVYYASFLGGHETETEGAVSLSMDAAGNLVIIGNTQAEDYPVTNAYQATRFPGKDPYDQSVVITKLSPDAEQLLFSTYFGGAGSDRARAGALGESDDIFLTGSSSSTNLPLVNAQYLPPRAAFVARFDPDAQRLTWSTFWGITNGTQYTYDMALGEQDRVCVVGSLSDPKGFPITSDAVQKSYVSYGDGFVVMFIPKVAFDFDGDGRADPAVVHSAQGDWYIRNSTRPSVVGFPFGWNAVHLVAQDYDGDAITDIAIFNPDAAEWYILQSRDQTLMEGGPIQFGWAGVTPVAADYDGDGRADMAVFDPVAANWFIRSSATGQLFDGGPIQFGWAGVTPIVSDYDGDDQADIAVYNPPTGDWFIRLSSSGAVRQEQFGWESARPLPSDYDGDGAADVAVYDPQGGRWFIQPSQNPGDVREIAFGWEAATPVPADYDGDGITDIAVFDQQNGVWFIERSFSGQLDQFNWGWDQTIPVSNYP